MKYFVFCISMLGVPPLAFLLCINKRWMKYAFWGMAAAMCFYQGTSINFFSHEEYRGSARGMEVSLAHLLAAAVLLGLAFRHKLKGFLPEWGMRIYALYFLLCLPSLATSADGMISWFELWKMILIHVFCLAVYSYLRATDDLQSVVLAIAGFAITNFIVAAKQHYLGMYQPGGVFQHRNSMAMAMNLTGTLFFAAFLMNGIRGGWFRKICAIAFVFSAISALWSYSRGALAMIPVGYGVTAILCLVERKSTSRKFLRLAPVLLAGLLGVAMMLPRIVERFEKAPKASGDTRVALAHCALEMIKDEPFRGVGINNWSIKMSPSYSYQDAVAVKLDRTMDYTGIVETVYLLVAAECGLPAFAAMVAWFAWYWFGCLRLVRSLRGSKWAFVPAGLFGGLTAAYLQSTLEWVLRMSQSLMLQAFLFAMIGYMLKSRSRLAKESTPEAKDAK